MAISTILITARRNTALAATIINRGPTGPAGAAGADGADGEDGASDVGDLTTDGLTPGEVLVVDNPSGVTTLALGTAALVNTGTGATNAILGNDSRLTDPRTPNDHTHGYTDLLPESEEFAVSSSVYFDGSNNLTLTSQDSHRLRIGTDDMVGYSGVLKLGSAPTAGTVVIVWNARTDTTTVKNSDDETLGTIWAGNCALLTSDGDEWTFSAFSQRALLTLAEISPLPIANGGTGAATAPNALTALGGGAVGTGVFAAATAGAAFNAVGTLATAPPNDTVNSLNVAVNSAAGTTNVALNLQPKGSGAFYLGPVANGKSTGGNPRGTNAVDLQKARTSPSQVSSGEMSFCAGGYNTASDLTAIALGNGCHATGHSAFASGYSSVADANRSQAHGCYATARGIIGAHAHGPHSYIYGYILGKAQTRDLIIGKETTSDTPAVLVSDASAAGAANQLVLPNNSAFHVKGTVIANVTGAGDTSAWEFKAAIKRGANAASTALVAAVTPTLIAQDSGASTWAVAVTADTTNGCLAVTVTGQADTTIRWVCLLESTEVTY